VRTLADIQAGIRDALVDGNGAAVAPVLLGGSRPAQRLAIHQRHYVASLIRALVERFPATVWLVGSELDARRHLVHSQASPIETVRR
jgi:hypothetical protein